MVFPQKDGLLMHMVQTDQGRVEQPKTITAHSEKEQQQLQKMGWQVKA